MKSYVLLCLLTLNGGFLSISQPTNDIREFNDLLYFSGEGFEDQKHRLNLVLPTKHNAPLLLWIHGGAWSGGDRKFEMPFARKLARAGIATAVISYRLSPAEYRNPPSKDGVRHPEHILDVARAFKWIFQQARAYGYDPNNLFVSGFSAGGHLSALLAMDEQYLSKYMLSFKQVAGCIPVSGTYDIPHYFRVITDAYDKKFAQQHVNGVFGSDSNFITASPVHYIDQLEVPMLVLTDGALSIYADQFKKFLTEKGRTDIEFRYFHSFDHNGLYNNLLFEEKSEARVEIINFVMNKKRT